LRDAATFHNGIHIKEKRHRLPKEFYKGETSIAFTLCLKGDIQPFISSETVGIFTDILSIVVRKTVCIVPVYCFMPDHQHLIITGTRSHSDIWKAMISYKQQTGFWMSANNQNIRWQKDFYDHVIRADEDMVAQVKYILDNPVRRGLVSSWQDYPFKGSIGCKLEDVLLGII
jgi:REP element-mobilizing transposase RayT